MSKKIRANVLIIDKSKILLIHRQKNGNEYFVLPGGSVEDGESMAEGAIREAKEETGLAVTLENELFWKFNNETDDRDNVYYLVTKYSGTLQLGKPEIDRVSDTNQYFLEWHDLNTINKLKLFPEALKMKIVETFIKDSQ